MTLETTSVRLGSQKDKRTKRQSSKANLQPIHTAYSLI